MLYYQPENRKQGRIIAGAATLSYLLILLSLLLLVRFTFQQESAGEGILINFGNVEEAAPGADLALNEEIADAHQQQQADVRQNQEELLTQETEEAPAIQQRTRPQQQTNRTNTTNANRQSTTQTPSETPREVDRRALFPGRTEGSTATSDGTGQGVGNQGNLAGDPAGSHDGTGLGTSGGSADLHGRSLTSNLPRPDYNAREQGRVIVEISVNQEGKVTSAIYRSIGSTTQNSTLVDAALRAARQARFNVDSNAPLSQQGIITYNFRIQ